MTASNAIILRAKETKDEERNIHFRIEVVASEKFTDAFVRGEDRPQGAAIAVVLSVKDGKLDAGVAGLDAEDEAKLLGNLVAGLAEKNSIDDASAELRSGIADEILKRSNEARDDERIVGLEKRALTYATGVFANRVKAIGGRRVLAILRAWNRVGSPTASLDAGTEIVHRRKTAPKADEIDVAPPKRTPLHELLRFLVASGRILPKSVIASDPELIADALEDIHADASRELAAIAIRLSRTRRLERRIAALRDVIGKNLPGDRRSGREKRRQHASNEEETPCG
jgi:hypothetical protein